MTERIELHEDDVDAVARHILDVEEPCGSSMPAFCFDDMLDDQIDAWHRWARAGCAGAAAFACCARIPAWTAAREMARVLAERRVAGAH